MDFSNIEVSILFFCIVFAGLNTTITLCLIQRDKVILPIFFLFLTFRFLEPIIYIVCSKNKIKNIVFLSALYILIVILILNHYHKIKKKNTLQVILVGEEIYRKKEQKKRKKQLNKKQKRVASRQNEKRYSHREISKKQKRTRKRKHKHDK